MRSLNLKIKQKNENEEQILSGERLFGNIFSDSNLRMKLDLAEVTGLLYEAECDYKCYTDEINRINDFIEENYLELPVIGELYDRILDLELDRGTAFGLISKYKKQEEALRHVIDRDNNWEYKFGID